MIRKRLKIKRKRFPKPRKGKKSPKPKKITKAKLAKQARTLARKSLKRWGEEVRKPGKCAVCGAGVKKLFNSDGTPRISKSKNPKRRRQIYSRLDAHHLLPKERYKTIRTEIMNGVCLCSRCHKWSKFSVHRNGIWFSEWLRKNRPKQFAWVLAHINDD